MTLAHYLSCRICLPDLLANACAGTNIKGSKGIAAIMLQIGDADILALETILNGRLGSLTNSV